MRRFLFISALLAFCCACTEPVRETENVRSEDGDDILIEDGPHIEFTAQTEGMGSKLTLDGFDALWSEGDAITVMDASGNRSLYRATGAGARTTFEYVSGVGPVDAPYTAWFPAEIADGYIPAAYSFTGNGVSPVPMKAVSSDTDFIFKNLTGLVRVRLRGPHNDICAVSLTAEKSVTGFYDASLEPGMPASVSGPSSVQLTAASPVDINAGVDFLFAVAQGTYESVCIAVLDSEDNLAYYSGSGVNVTRSAITGVGDIEVLSMGNDGGSTVNLSVRSTANCYLPTGKSDYKFYAAAKGNNGRGAEEFIPSSADILWAESEGAGVFNAIYPVILYNNYVYFRKCRATDVFYPGNAVVAVRDVSGEILWSWHLWMPEQTQEDGSKIASGYANSAGTVMAYGLGETKGKRDGGFFYQWGRKDPFPQDYQSRDGFPAAVETSSEVGSLGYASAHPMQFVYGNNASCYDWAVSTRDSRGWEDTEGKGLCDPCPPGWHVPDGGGCGISAVARGETPIFLHGLWTVAFGTGVGFCGRNSDGSLYWDGTPGGISLPASIAGRESFYAAAGILSPEDGKPAGKGWTGSCWTRGAENSGGGVASAAYCFSFGASGHINPTGLSNKAAGRNVRCVED